MNANGTEQVWLQQLIGEWDSILSMDAAPAGAEPAAVGTERVWAIGESWIISENRSKGSDGAASHTVTLIGFEPAKGRFTGGVAGTMAPVFFPYDGALSDDGSELHIETEGPALTEGKASDRYRDVFRVIDADSREVIAQVLDDDGTWRDFLRTRFRRRVMA